LAGYPNCRDCYSRGAEVCRRGHWSGGCYECQYDPLQSHCLLLIHDSQLLINSGANTLLIRDNPTSLSAIGTFGYNDLNAYLLTVIGVARADEDRIQDFRQIAMKAKEGVAIPVREVMSLAQKEPLTLLPHTANLLKAVETFGTGIHRIIVVREGTQEVMGLLSQTKLVRFLWENGRSFPVIDQLFPQYLRDLKIGSNQVISIK
jgi:CBS domain